MTQIEDTFCEYTVEYTVEYTDHVCLWFTVIWVELHHFEQKLLMA